MIAPDVRRLILVRHAEAAASGPSDHERDLTPRGTRVGRELGEWLRAEGLVPDAVVASDARRVQRTWDEMASGGGLELDPIFCPALYAADPDAVLDLVRTTTGARTLLVLGHNPTIASLAHLLQDGRGDRAAGVRMAQGYPPAAATVLAFTGEWKDLFWGAMRLEAFHTGR